MHLLSKQQRTAQGFCHSSLLLTSGDLCGTFLVVKPEVAATLMQFSDLHSEEEQRGLHCSREACTREGLIPCRPLCQASGWTLHHTLWAFSRSGALELGSALPDGISHLRDRISCLSLNFELLVDL